MKFFVINSLLLYYLFIEGTYVTYISNLYNLKTIIIRNKVENLKQIFSKNIYNMSFLMINNEILIDN